MKEVLQLVTTKLGFLLPVKAKVTRTLGLVRAAIQVTDRNAR